MIFWPVVKRMYSFLDMLDHRGSVVDDLNLQEIEEAINLFKKRISNPVQLSPNFPPEIQSMR